MKAIDESELDECHEKFVEICFLDFPLSEVHTHVSPKIKGWGTNINEKIESFSDFTDLLALQREQSRDIEMSFQFEPISKTILGNGTSCVFMDDIFVEMKVDGENLNVIVRLNSVFEKEKDVWKAVNFNGSIPQGVKGNDDTWSVNEWKSKNEELERKIAEKTKDLEKSIEDLKQTQAQLIQSEKMASLGELTAGIAHEIQNPLNFVNNFSEVSKELLEEMLEELQNGDMEEVDVIAGDVIQNLEKILHHGQRADSIVKGMLQHSRSHSGEKEPTNINQLTDEYLRLAYHGLRAKDKSFNAEIETHYDDAIGSIYMVPQDIGRVVLNLMTNAFHACNEKKKTSKDADFTPKVLVSTKHNGSTIQIYVADNGNGIPSSIKDKIFQPFFTTKPTGQGTGLGLSLSYDIIKSHSGDISVKTEEGTGTEFIISLPITEEA